jgi:hypothetical protein
MRPDLHSERYRLISTVETALIQPLCKAGVGKAEEPKRSKRQIQGRVNVHI